MTISPSSKQRLIMDYMKTPAGRHKLAVSMIQPLKMRVAYRSLLTRVVAHHSAPLSEAMEFEGFDEDVHTLGMLETLAHTQFKKMTEGQFDFIENVVSRMSEEVISWHNRKLVSSLAENLEPMESMPSPYNGGSVLMDPVSHAWFRKNMSHVWDPVCTAELLRAGLLGAWCGSDLFISRHCPVGVILFVPPKDEYGVVYADEKVLSYDDPMRREMGFALQAHAVVVPGKDAPPVYAWAPPIEE